MKQPEEQDPLDTLLREQDVYINDDGFTARVVASLPPRRWRWLRPVVLLGSVGVGIVLTILWVPWANLPPLDVSAMVSLNPQVLMPWGVVLAVAASLVWATVAAALSED
jgi:hypothetical protein